MTAYELARLCINDPDFTDTFTITYEDGTPIEQTGDGALPIEGIASPGTSFAHGAEGTALTSTAAQIDNAVAVAPSYTATFNTATAASKVLTVAATPAEGETVTIGTTPYRARLDELSATGVKATGTLDLTADAPHDGDTVILGLITYTFKTSLTPTAGEVLIEATSAGCIDNLVAAITGGAGAGTKYATGTSPSPNVTVVRASDTMVTTYISYGTLGNSFDTLGTMTHGSWGATALTGGVNPMESGDIFVDGTAEKFIINLEKAIEGGETNGEGGNYYLSPAGARTDVSVTAKDASTMTVTALTKGTTGNSIALAETLGNASSKWAGDATTLSGGVNGTVAAATGQVIFTASAAYFCTDATKCTISDSSGWKRAALS
jgi:hypothetical protein